MDKKKKNLLIGGLLAVVLLLAVGYAAFATTLTINGTSTIDSRWDVHIKDNGVSYKNAVMATSTRAQKDSQLTASFACELTDPGVSTIDYDVIVENTGTFGAKLSSINLTGTTSYIDATTSGIEVGDVIDPNGGTDTLTVTVSYKNVSEVPTGEDATANITVTLNYIQDDGSSSGGGGSSEPVVINGLTIDQTFVPQYYEYHTSDYVTLGQSYNTSTWTQDPTTLTGHNYYLGHDVESGNVTANYVCFIIDNTQYCMKSKLSDGTIYFNENKALLGTLKDLNKITCTDFDDENGAECSSAEFGWIYATTGGFVRVGENEETYCMAGHSRFSGRSTCIE